MEDLLLMIKAILSQNGGWMVLIALIAAIAIVLIMAIVILIKGTKSIGERISDSVDNNVNKKSEIRLKELDVRREELRIQEMLAAANIASTSTINDLVKTNTEKKEVKPAKVTETKKCESRNKSLNSDIKKTRKAARVLTKHNGGFSR